MFWIIALFFNMSIPFQDLPQDEKIIISQEINYLHFVDDIKKRECEFLKSKWWGCEQFQKSEENGNLKYWVIACISVAETWLWKNTMRDYNIWNCWKYKYPNWDSWINWIQKFCLNWIYLWNKMTIWDFGKGAWSCEIDCNYFYAKDWLNREKNVSKCLSDIYGFPVDHNFIIRNI